MEKRSSIHGELLRAFRVNPRVGRMRQTLAFDHRSRETDVALVAAVEVRELLARMRQAREAVVPVRPGAVLDAELLEPSNELLA
ncbi:MAG: hypothetical protein EXS08_10900 [Planctomycetes bacterium]|nr:hypothetical protein [Planctomycetota bacterium]